MEIAPQDLLASQGEFGLRPELMHLELPGFKFEGKYRTPAEKQRLEQRMAAARQAWEGSIARRRAERLAGIQRGGFLLTGDALEPNFPLLHRLNIPRTMTLARELERMARTKPPPEGGVLGLALSFVQELEYRVPPDRRGDLFTSGLLLPLEVLASAAGDCDSKCLLLACLLGGVCRNRLVLLHGDSHMVLGVAQAREPKQHAVGFDGSVYVLCEASSGVWRPGQTSDKTMQAVRAGRYRAVKLEVG
jgi:hypothetical protein